MRTQIPFSQRIPSKMIRYDFLFSSLLLLSSIRDAWGRPILHQSAFQKVHALKEKLMRNVDSGLQSAKSFLVDKYSRLKNFFRQRDLPEKAGGVKMNLVRSNGNGVHSVVKRSHHAPKRQQVIWGYDMIWRKPKVNNTSWIYGIRCA